MSTQRGIARFFVSPFLLQTHQFRFAPESIF